MDNVNKTLYIPLYGKAYVSRLGILLRDAKAEQIWAAESFPLKGKSRSKWLAYYMGMRAAEIERWVQAQMDSHPDAIVLHIGCGMDSRAERVGHPGHLWLDLDFPEVIHERSRYYRESENYRMIPADIRDPRWLEPVPTGGPAVVVMEGVSMYLRPEELKQLFRDLNSHFSQAHLLMDCYTEFAARVSRVKNPVNDVGVTQVYGLDDPRVPEPEAGLSFVKEWDMTPPALVSELQGMERAIFKALYAGRFARKLYRLYEYG